MKSFWRRSEYSHKTRKAWIPTHYAHGIVALNHLGVTEERIREYIQWQVLSVLFHFFCWSTSHLIFHFWGEFGIF